ncbi:MAG: DNA polymerase I [Phycisphaeraceae bacterium]|nr:DNA polymerase I [Phycisphaeraceae bacterium]
MAKRKTLYLIDGYAQMFRAYYAIRSLSSPVTQEPTNATFGFVGMLIKLFRDMKPDYVALALDVSGDRGTFRSQIDPQYKANREPPPEDFRPQVDRMLEICRMWGIPILSAEGYEADDVIATCCERLGDRDDLDIRIVSKDKDLEQLLGDHVSLYDIHKDIEIDAKLLEETKGIRPEQVVDVLALMGDNVDNIPGAKGVGPKTAVKLISKFGSLDNLLAHTDQLKGKQKENIEAAAERMPTNLDLVRLRRDTPFEFDLEQAKTAPPPVEPLVSMFRQLGFTRHVSELEALGGGSKPQDDPPPTDSLFSHLGDAGQAPVLAKKTDEADHRLVRTKKQLNELVRELKKLASTGHPLAVDTETDRLNPMRCRLVGLCLSWQATQGWYVPVRSSRPDDHLDETTVLEALKPFLEDERIPKTGQNLKYDWLVLQNAGVDLKPLAFDTMVASYLIDATRSSHKLDALAMAFLNYQPIPITRLIGSGKHQRSMIDLPAEEVADYSAEDAEVTYRLREVLAPKLEAMDLLELFESLEMPLVEVLGRLERNGIRLDLDELSRQEAPIDQRIADLRDEILEVSDADFNPDSPKQLAEVLFRKLKCTVVKRRKTGPSTDSEVLQRIANEQEPPGSLVAALVLEYRQLSKLRSTYLQALREAVHPETGRIHASFNQTVTATGRLSSSDPNLQNIPIRTDLGRQIRKAFVAPRGARLISADYSQIELRMLAHLSGDERLIEAFEQDLDIHAAVAAEVFDVPLDEVTAEQRGVAKMVNFGIVYGITPYGLARRLPADTAGSSVEVARQIIDDYKARYPKINQFLAECVQQADQDGYVQTISRRRRPIPEIHSRNGNLRSVGQRMAINTVVQGSAADLIKLAMVRLDRRIEEEALPLKMLLQIHDELVFEAPTKQVKAMAKIVAEEMTGAMALNVPLKVEIASGTNWYEAK